MRLKAHRQSVVRASVGVERYMQARGLTVSLFVMRVIDPGFSCGPDPTLGDPEMTTRSLKPALLVNVVYAFVIHTGYS